MAKRGTTLSSKKDRSKGSPKTAKRTAVKYARLAEKAAPKKKAVK